MAESLQACVGDQHNLMSRAGFPAGRGSLAISSETAAQYAHRVGTNASSFCYVIQMLSIGRLVYGKKSPGVPPGSGDCGSDTNIDLGFSSKVSTGLQIGGGGLATASSLAPTVTVLGTAATIVGLAAIPFEIFSLFGAHHARAVAREQATLCAVAVAYNRFADAIEAALAAGKLTAQDAIRLSDQAVNQLVEAMRPIFKTCNFACGMTYAVRALGLYNKEVFYPSFTKSAALGGPAAEKEKVFGAVIGAVGGILLR